MIARWTLPIALVALLVAGCATAEPAPTSLGGTGDIAPPAAEDVSEGDGVRTLTILYTNDEHGWMAGMDPGEGAAELLGLWEAEEGYTPDGPFLLLSGGDMWTGPAISTWFQGASMAEVMNAMGYDGAAVGNHEFDFGLDTLRARAAQSAFPFLSANVREKSGGAVPEGVGIQTYALVEANGITVGLIGLTTTSTPRTTNPVNVAGFDFLDYEAALRETVPLAQAAGAELILVPAHVCQGELESLALRIGDLGVHMLGGGHCNELFAKEVNGIVLIGGGYHFTSYARATFTMNTAGSELLSTEFGVGDNRGGGAASGVSTIVARWQDEADAELNQVIGYTEDGVGRRTPTMEALITEAWLWSYPNADAAFTNLGGIRADLPRGNLTLADVVGVLPFSNTLIEMALTGRQLLLLTGRDSLTFGGIRQAGNSWALERTGEPIDVESTYMVLTNDFLYAGGDGMDELARYDPDAYNTAIDWRQPVIDWIMTQASSPEQPLDAALRELWQ